MIFSEKEIKVAIDKDIEVEAEKYKNYMRNLIKTNPLWSTGQLAKTIKKKKVTVAEYEVGILDEDVSKFDVKDGYNYAYIYASGRGAIDLRNTNPPRYMVVKDKDGNILAKTQYVKGYGGNDFVGKTISKFG